MIAFLLANRKWIGYGLAAVLVAALLLAYRHSLIVDGRRQGEAKVQALWDADVAAREAVANKAIVAARAKEAAARAANEVIVNEYTQKLVSIAGERDGYYGLLRQARGTVLACRANQATDQLIAATAGEAAVAERIDRAIAAVIVESKLNAEQLDALIAVVNGQM